MGENGRWEWRVEELEWPVKEWAAQMQAFQNEGWNIINIIQADGAVVFMNRWIAE